MCDHHDQGHDHGHGHDHEGVDRRAFLKTGAAAGVAHRLGLCDARVRVEMRGGSLSVEIGKDFSVVQSGPVVRVAEGTLCAEALAAP